MEDGEGNTACRAGNEDVFDHESSAFTFSHLVLKSCSRLCFAMQKAAGRITPGAKAQPATGATVELTESEHEFRRPGETRDEAEDFYPAERQANHWCHSHSYSDSISSGDRPQRRERLDSSTAVGLKVEAGAVMVMLPLCTATTALTPLRLPACFTSFLNEGLIT